MIHLRLRHLNGLKGRFNYNRTNRIAANCTYLRQQNVKRQPKCDDQNAEHNQDLDKRLKDFQKHDHVYTNLKTNKHTKPGQRRRKKLITVPLLLSWRVEW